MIPNNTSLSFLTNLHSSHLNLLVKILNTNNILLDEENDLRFMDVGISRNIFEKWNDNCTKYIIENGYSNNDATFICTAVQLNSKGFVYCIYDANIIDTKIAIDYMKKYDYKDRL
jgi:hypothetical protein